MRANKGYYEDVALDPGGCTRDICGGSARTGAFLGRTRAGAGKTPRPKDGENSRENLFSQLRSTQHD